MKKSSSNLRDTNNLRISAWNLTITSSISLTGLWIGRRQSQKCEHNHTRGAWAKRHKCTFLVLNNEIPTSCSTFKFFPQMAFHTTPIALIVSIKLKKTCQYWHILYSLSPLSIFLASLINISALFFSFFLCLSSLSNETRTDTWGALLMMLKVYCFSALVTKSPFGARWPRSIPISKPPPAL